MTFPAYDISEIRACAFLLTDDQKIERESKCCDANSSVNLFYCTSVTN